MNKIGGYNTKLFYDGKPINLEINWGITMNKEKNQYHSFNVGDIIRIDNYPTATGYRVWQIVSHKLGGEGYEGFYELKCLDKCNVELINVPCIILETNKCIEKV